MPLLPSHTTMILSPDNPVLLSNSNEELLLPPYDLMFFPKLSFQDLFPSKSMSQNPLLGIPSVLAFASPFPLTFTLNSSNFNLHWLLTEDLSLIAPFSLPHPFALNLVMNSSFWSFNLWVPLLRWIRLLIPQSWLCHPAPPFLTSSQLPSITLLRY